MHTLFRLTGTLGYDVATLNCRQAPAAITRKGYDALPARCVRMRFCVGPKHNNMFVIYSLDVTLVGNS